LAVDFAFRETFFALTAAHLAFAASEMRFRPAALIFRVGAFAGLLVLAWIFCPPGFLGCGNAGANGWAHLPLGSLLGFRAATALSFDMCPPRTLSSRNPSARRRAHLSSGTGVSVDPAALKMEAISSFSFRIFSWMSAAFLSAFGEILLEYCSCFSGFF
jgi:hypothetical protein